MPALTQEGKFIAIESSLGTDELILLSFSGNESISNPFSFSLEMLSENHNIKPGDIVGQKVDITLNLSDGSPRYFNGHIAKWVAGNIHGNGYRCYHAEMVPWLQLLSLSTNCRIFQNADVKVIIEEVFSEAGFSDFEISTQLNFRMREYTVQYRESDLQFVSRLMEEEGIFYYFKHDLGKHTLVIADAVGSYVDCTESKIHFFDGGRTADKLTEWENQYQLVSGKYSQTDFNFKTPGTDISTLSNTIIDLPILSDYEKYDYPGLYEDRGAGDGLTKALIEAEETAYNIVTASGGYRSFMPGGKFTVETHQFQSEVDKQYVVTQITHYARENSYDLNQAGSHDYNNNFQCIPADVAFRPRRATPKPVVQGPQTAFVVGPSDEEIYTDEFGRIKVQFHWDRVGKKNENSSCWLRVSQQMAGKKWGAIFLPRIGHEVIVSFLEGNPDMPLVTGCVYNADNMPPYDLPANKTQSGWKTRSTKDGGTANFNELRFEDLKGSEEIYIHAEKDQNNHVENNETTFVGSNRTEDVGNDEKITIGNNRTESVGTDETITIGNHRTESVGKDETISIGENRTVSVGKDESITISDGQIISIGKDLSEDIGKSLAQSIGDDRGVDVGKDDSLKVGKKLTIEAGDQITFKTGKAKIVMKKDGSITISGKDINLKGSGKINIKASKDIIMKGSKIAQN